ncbi:MAG: hypothetical protein ABI851_13850 [Saprospiraceae bacterium]
MHKTLLWVLVSIFFNQMYGQSEAFDKYPPLNKSKPALRPPSIASGKYPVIDIELSDIENGVLLNFYPFMKFEVLNKSTKEIAEDSKVFELIAIRATKSGDSIVLIFNYKKMLRIYFVKPVVNADMYQYAMKRFNESMKEVERINERIKNNMDSVLRTKEKMTEFEKAYKDVHTFCETPICSLFYFKLERQMNFTIDHSANPPTSKYLQFFDIQERRIPLKEGILLNLTDNKMNLIDEFLYIKDNKKKYIILYILNEKLYYSDQKKLLEIINSKNNKELKLLMHSTENTIENLRAILGK